MIYFLNKNINYSISNLLNNNFLYFPWPNYPKKIKNVDYIEYIKNDFKLNLIIKNEGAHSGSPVMCGNVKMPCLPLGRKICISDIYKINNYIFLENKNKNCLLQFKKNYWQH